MMLFSLRVPSLLAICASLTGVALANDGDATFFNTGLGSCGVQNVDTDFIVALSPQQMNGGATCFQEINVHFQGQSIQATVVDTCPGCGSNDVDLSPSAFQALASLDLGRIQVEWDFV